MADFSVFSYGDEDLRLPPRPSDSHKGTFGKVLCVCGTEGMCGAAYFAAKAAYRSGAGLVKILTVASNRPVLQGLIPEAIVTVYDDAHPDPNTILEAVEWADVLVVGCGLGTSSAARALLSHVLRTASKPLVLDADALNLISQSPSPLSCVKGAILTPHMGEMARLCGIEIDEIQKDPQRVAYRFAKRHEVVCVLKGHRTVISDGGSRLFLNSSGNSGMATGGSGDVLAGILGGLLAQSQNQCISPLELTALGVYLHGKSGDLAAERRSEYSVMASDLLDCLPEVMKRLSTSD